MGKIIDAEGNIIPTHYPSPALRAQMEEDERKALAGAEDDAPLAERIEDIFDGFEAEKAEHDAWRDRIDEYAKDDLD